MEWFLVKFRGNFTFILRNIIIKKHITSVRHTFTSPVILYDFSMGGIALHHTRMTRQLECMYYFRTGKIYLIQH